MEDIFASRRRRRRVRCRDQCGEMGHRRSDQPRRPATNRPRHAYRRTARRVGGRFPARRSIRRVVAARRDRHRGGDWETRQDRNRNPLGVTRHRSDQRVARRFHGVRRLGWYRRDGKQNVGVNGSKSGRKGLLPSRDHSLTSQRAGFGARLDRRRRARGTRTSRSSNTQ